MNMIIAVMLMVAATLLSAYGMFLLKLAAKDFTLHPIKLLLNWKFVLAGVSYIASLAIYVIILKSLPLMIAYPMTSMNYIWAALLAQKYLDEKIDIWRWSGIGLIIVGIIVLAI